MDEDDDWWVDELPANHTPGQIVTLAPAEETAPSWTEIAGVLYVPDPTTPTRWRESFVLRVQAPARQRRIGFRPVVASRRR